MRQKCPALSASGICWIVAKNSAATPVLAATITKQTRAAQHQAIRRDENSLGIGGLGMRKELVWWIRAQPMANRGQGRYSIGLSGTHTKASP